MKTFLYRSFIGIIFGGFLHVLLVCIGIISTNAETINAESFGKNAAGMMICSWFFTVTPLYFEIRKWNSHPTNHAAFFDSLCAFLPCILHDWLDSCLHFDHNQAAFNISGYLHR